MKTNTILTRDEVDALSDEQKDAYARVVLADARIRRGLDARARGYSGSSMVPVLLIVVGAALVIWTPSLEWIVIVGLLAVVIALQWQAHGLNRRLDAVLELLTCLEKRVDEPEQEEEGSVAPP